MRRWRSAQAMLCVALGLLLPWPCEADVLAVGAGQTYATPCQAVATAKPHDVIEIAAGTYTDSCSIAVAGVTLRGVNGQPKIDLSGTDHPAQYKGIYVIDAEDVTIENLELTGAHISDDNGTNAAGIRVQAAGLTVRGCNIHDNQNGILGGTTGTLTIEHSEFFRNGVGDGCNQGGCTHNLYIANIDTLNFRFNWSHGMATDTNDKGHLLKSRAKTNYILYNRLSGEDGFDSYELNFPNGGLAIVIGNLVQKGAKAGNGTLLSWGEEGTSNAEKRVFVASNTFVNDLGSGRFLNIAAGGTLVAHNNLFVGAGTVSNGAGLSADNLTVDPSFVDRAHFDYHLLNGSAAIGKAIDPGSADQFSLRATSLYVHPLAEGVRSKLEDVGAYEFSQSDVARPGMRPAPAGANGGGGVVAGAGGAAPSAGAAAMPRPAPAPPAAGSGGAARAAGASAATAGAAAAGSGGASATKPQASSSGCRLVAAPAYSLLEPTLIGLCLAWGAVRWAGRSRSSRSSRAGRQSKGAA